MVQYNLRGGGAQGHRAVVGTEELAQLGPRAPNGRTWKWGALGFALSAWWSVLLMVPSPAVGKKEVVLAAEASSGYLWMSVCRMVQAFALLPGGQRQQGTEHREISVQQMVIYRALLTS